VSAGLGTIHFWMSVKRDITDPLIFAVIFAILLGYRVVVAADARAKRGVRAVPQTG
jgi:DMSO/TMAO reductase YedYZ heme-binding membrane subunit